MFTAQDPITDFLLVDPANGYSDPLPDMETGDFNGDGREDLAISDVMTDTLYVFLSSGDGTFEPAVRYRTGLWPYELTIDDINNDDIPDILVSTYVYNGVSVFIGIGDGAFQDAIHYMTGYRPTSIATGDFDGNGSRDLVLTSIQEEVATVIWSLLDIPVVPPPPTPTPVNPGGGGLGDPSVNALPPISSTPFVLPCELPASTHVSGGYYSLVCHLLPEVILNKDIPPHTLVKVPNDSAVYYMGLDGKRRAFPSKKVYSSWYENFDGVQLVNEAQMSSIPLGKNVTYKPGKRMVKFTTDNKVYAVAKGGILRWITTEEVATELYGSSWNTQIDDISDAFYTNYMFGQNVTGLTDFNPTTVQASVQFPSDSLEMQA